MGRSAKLLKRVKKKTAPSSTNTQSQRPATQASSSVAVPTTKRRSQLKDKAAGSKRGPSEGHVLGGADYVDLMMGSRRRAREEAAKLPQD